MAENLIRKIIHVDMDAFYASVEQRDNPTLRGKPVVVGSSSKRGVVAAASYEARVFGVRSAMPSLIAQRLCPSLVFVPTRFDVYKAVSRQIHEIFADYTDVIEPLSLDEAYLDVTRNIRGLPTAADTASEIRQRIYDKTGLTASAGVSYNKFLAKLASDIRKPNGQCVISPKHGPSFIEELAVKKFHGIGPVTAARLNALGIHTGTDLKEQPLALLEQHFGKSGGWFYNIARGVDNRPVNPNRIRKSSGAEKTFSTDLTQPTDIENKVLEMADEVWEWCEQNHCFGATATVKIKYADFQLLTRSRTAQQDILSQSLLRSTCLDLVRSVFPVPRGVRLVGVSVSNFQRPTRNKPDQNQLDLRLDT